MASRNVVLGRLNLCVRLFRTSSSRSHPSLTMDTINPCVKKLRGPLPMLNLSVKLFRTSSSRSHPCLTMDTINPCVKTLRGPLPMLNLSVKLFRTSSSRSHPCLTMDTINPCVKKLRGPIPILNLCVRLFRTSSSRSHPSLTMDTLNPCVKKMEYAIRGPIPLRARALEIELEKGVKKPFKAITQAHLGDGQAVGQKPLTFVRQVIALVTHPYLLNDPRFPEDLKRKAESILRNCKGSSVGAYTDTHGMQMIREEVASFIQRRDGHGSKWNDVALTTGATSGIKTFLHLFACDVSGKRPGVMIPIPQFPLYSATLTTYDIQIIKYYLAEANEWALDVGALKRAYDEGSKTCLPRAIVVINPGNPTGQVLSRENIETIIKFAHDNNLFILADEVYQENIYAKDARFHSFKKVLVEMGSSVELVSFNSCSKGVFGECGFRGGYLEVHNMDPECQADYYKSLRLIPCPSVIGQVVTSCMVNTPKQGDPSYALYSKERLEIFNSLKAKAEMVSETFNTFKGMSCNPVQGAMYAFPRINLPLKAVKAAETVGQAPDEFYAFQLLENTGIIVIPGTGFGQEPGTYHIRTTILPRHEELESMLEKFREFHDRFMKTYE